MNNNKYFYGTGKRKTSIARVFLKNGTGTININNSNNYLENKKIISIIKKPLYLLNIINKIDLKITVKGGGLIGQAEAIKHGISKALVKLNENNDVENTYRKKLKKVGYLTRDSRKVERKKVGRKKSRKKEQYSKR